VFALPLFAVHHLVQQGTWVLPGQLGVETDIPQQVIPSRGKPLQIGCRPPALAPV
jgi:hypothetical protein